MNLETKLNLLSQILHIVELMIVMEKLHNNTHTHKNQ